MSLTQRVTAMVEDRGSATVDLLAPELAQEGFTREQVKKALQNAKFAGYLDCDGHVPKRGEGGGCGSVPGTYRPARANQPIKVAPMPRVASVWELGAAHRELDQAAA